MRSEILVPLDGSRYSEAILPHVLAMASATDCSIALLRVIAPPLLIDLMAGPSDRWAMVRAAYEQEAAQIPAYLARVAARLRGSGATVRWEVREGDPAGQILSRTTGADGTVMIAMARHGRSGLMRWVLGSVAERVLHEARVPVLLVPLTDQGPASAAKPAYHTVVVPLDGSSTAEQALSTARCLAGKLAAELLLLRVIDAGTPEIANVTDVSEVTNVLPWGSLDEFRDQIRGSKRYLDEKCQAIQSQELQVRSEVAFGSPVEQILRVATAQSGSLIVMASSGWSGYKRLIFGSVAMQVVRAAQGPILLVRAVRNDPHEDETVHQPGQDVFAPARVSAGR